MENHFKKWQKFINESDQSKIFLKDLMSGINKYKDSIWVFFDTETTGLNPDNTQLLEIAAIAVKSNLLDAAGVISKFHTKVNLTQDTEKKRKEPFTPSNPREKSIDDLLAMTQYYNDSAGAGYIDEKEALEKFELYLKSLKASGNIVLVAHNAPFDDKFIKTRSALYDLQLDQYEIIDTLQVMEEIFYPLIQIVDEKGILPKIKTKFGVSFTLGNVSKALDINIDDWHSALADVKMLIKITKSVLSLLEKNGDLDVTAGYQVAMKRKEKMAKFRNR